MATSNIILLVGGGIVLAVLIYCEWKLIRKKEQKKQEEFDHSACKTCGNTVKTDLGDCLTCVGRRLRKWKSKSNG